MTQPETPSPGEAPLALHHRCLADSTAGTSLSQARLTDQQRLAVVLQGAGLLGHLEHGGLFLPEGFQDARIASGGRLLVSQPRRGRPRIFAHTQLRQLLLRLFRSESTIAGRGEARRAARTLLSQWRQNLAPVPPDLAVEQILTAASFLWLPLFADARRALAGEHRVDPQPLHLVGSAGARRRFLATAETLEDLEAALTSDTAQDLWDGYRLDDSPQELLRAGRRRRALAAWQRTPPADSAEHVERAQTLFDLGLYTQSLEALRGRRDFESRLLRARCQDALGELRAARGTVRRLAGNPLSPERTLRLVEVAVHVAGSRRDHDAVRHWLERARSAVEKLPEDDGLHLRWQLLAAEAAWECQDLEAMEKHLALAEAAQDQPDLALPWHRARGLLANEIGDGLRAIEHLGRALSLNRRTLPPPLAGRLWSGLASGRVYADDLPGAERACRHALRLLTGCEGPLPTTLALHNLAEVRLRRGRLAGVEHILERSTAENRRADNRRALLYDLQLWVRLELAQGRPTAALARCREAFDHFEEGLSGHLRPVFESFAARALGWLGRRREAAEALDGLPPDHPALRELETEERPALYALAGLKDEARQAAESTPWKELCTTLLDGGEPSPTAWRALDPLEPFRAARFLFDCELFRPGAAPPRRVREAAAVLREMGAETSAERLENRSLGPWRALNRYLESARPGAEESPTQQTGEDLLRRAGYGEARLLCQLADGGERLLVDGPGGDERLELTTETGRFILRADRRDDILDTLLRLLARDLAPSLRSEGKVERRKSSLPIGGILGDSPALHQARHRLERLASGELPILLFGESGTGKELFARLAHDSSRRASGPFLPVNCAALSDTLVQTELFGHVRGAFTGADRDRAGVFETARGGTVFLDEIGDLSSPSQAKLLRVLQEKEIRRVGESVSRKVDVRIVAATHRNLAQMVKDGSFREDLYFRLAVATVELPPLRDRDQDALLLADHFLLRLRSDLQLSPDARRALLNYSWPGNVRELRHKLEMATALADGETLEPDHLALGSATPSPTQGTYHEQVERLRKRLITEALAASGGNQAEAARGLGLTRQALSYLIKQFDLG